MEETVTLTTKLEELNLVDKFLFDETMEDKEAYQAQIDVSLLEPGSTDFNLLNDSCFILIAPFDIFGKELYRYTFEGVCRECPELKLGDGAVKIFINTRGKNREEFSEEFLDFMEYITESTDKHADETKSERIKLIHEKVKRIKASEKAGVRYMQRWEEIAYARQDGMAEGLEQGIRAFLSVCHDFGASRESIVDKLKEQFNLEDGKAEEYMQKYWA